MHHRAVVVLAVLLPSTGCMNHYLIYSKNDAPGVMSWSQDVTRGPLRAHLEWMQPPGSGPFPTVIVHPPAGDTASDMKGVTRDLAEHGYLAVAVDYWRLIDGKFQRSTFVWRQQSDPVAALEIVRAQPQTDRERIGALGFSQGAIFSLLMAAQATDVKAVVAYYPVTDFRLWFDTERPLGPRLAFNVIEWYFKRESGATSDAQFEEILRLASPMTYVDSIRAPVLLIHGADDTSAPVEESKRLERALRARGREVELIVVPDAGHVFNFRNAEQARRAWDATLDWLQKYLTQAPTSAPKLVASRSGRFTTQPEDREHGTRRHPVTQGQDFRGQLRQHPPAPEEEAGAEADGYSEARRRALSRSIRSQFGDLRQRVARAWGWSGARECPISASTRTTVTAS